MACNTVPKDSSANIQNTINEREELIIFTHDWKVTIQLGYHLTGGNNVIIGRGAFVGAVDCF